MDKCFDNFYNYKKFGPAIKTQAVPQSSLDKYRGKLPDQLLQYWQEYGWCGWADGLFWTVNPEEWDDVLDVWLEDTPFESKDAYHVIARSAFGELLLWGEKTANSVKVRCVDGQLYPLDVSDKIKLRGMDQQLQLFFAAKSREHMDYSDDDNKPLFERALKKLGPLNHDTMYGFEPALCLGGPAKLENLKILDAKVHLEILAQLGERQIMLDIGKLADSLPK